MKKWLILVALLLLLLALAAKRLTGDPINNSTSEERMYDRHRRLFHIP